VLPVKSFTVPQSTKLGTKPSTHGLHRTFQIQTIAYIHILSVILFILNVAFNIFWPSAHRHLFHSSKALLQQSTINSFTRSSIHGKWLEVEPLGQRRSVSVASLGVVKLLSIGIIHVSFPPITWEGLLSTCSPTHHIFKI
jgi:hypothetical protein